MKQKLTIYSYSVFSVCYKVFNPFNYAIIYFIRTEFLNNRLWGNLSNAFLKSVYMMLIFQPVSSASVHSCKICNNWVTVELHIKKPNYIFVLHIKKPNYIFVNNLFTVKCFIMWSLIIDSSILQIIQVRLTGL